MGVGQTFDENMFLLDRLFPAILDWMVFGENVAQDKGIYDDY